MNKIQKTNSLPSTHLESKEQEIAMKLYYVNILTPFRVDDSILELWSITVNRLLPDLETEELQSLMDAFMKNEVEFDRNLGIQNIFIGLAQKFPAKYEERKMVY